MCQKPWYLPRCELLDFAAICHSVESVRIIEALRAIKKFILPINSKEKHSKSIVPYLRINIELKVFIAALENVCVSWRLIKFNCQSIRPPQRIGKNRSGTPIYRPLGLCNKINMFMRLNLTNQWLALLTAFWRNLKGEEKQK